MTYISRCGNYCSRWVLLSSKCNRKRQAGWAVTQTRVPSLSGGQWFCLGCPAPRQGQLSKIPGRGRQISVLFQIFSGDSSVWPELRITRWALTNPFCKAPESKRFKLCGYTVCRNYLTAIVAQSNHRPHKKEGARLCSVKQGSKLNVACGRWSTQPRLHTENRLFCLPDGYAPQCKYGRSRLQNT